MTTDLQHLLARIVQQEETIIQAINSRAQLMDQYRELARQAKENWQPRPPAALLVQDDEWNYQQAVGAVGE